MSVTLINAGSQHNVVPASCTFVVDVRTTDVYSNTEVLEVIKEHVQSKVTARSVRLNSSRIGLDHPIVQSGLSLGKNIWKPHDERSSINSVSFSKSWAWRLGTLTYR